ncbi:MAG: type I methionyl aminopeptidase [Ponticaulis sp.]|nr:type I methionyl aminopeptidase [Ponticaulis sp.]
MRKAGQVASACLDMIAEHVKPDVATQYLDDLILEFVRDHGAASATVGYRGYRHGSCISINHVVCHGIPGNRLLKEGDIANIDVTVVVDGWHGDTSRMYGVGDVKRKASRLMDVTYDAMMAGISIIKPGIRVGDIGAAITQYAHKNRVSVVEDFCGHGLGRVFHDEPNVVHSARAGTGAELQPGMFFTVEPMLNLGRKDTVILPDGWTAVTRDRSLSAQFEHSVGVTEDGVEIFTTSPTGLHTPHKAN